MGLAPSLVSAMVRDPRVGIRMATLAAAPRLAGRLFGRDT
jgi:hypothetical protein